MAIRVSTYSDKAYKWSSRIVIKFLNSDYFYSDLIISHLREDVLLSAPTTFQSIIDMTPLGGALEQAQSITTFLGGKTIGGVAKFQQTQVWKSTEPLSIPFTLHFDTKTDSFKDVVTPAFALLGYTVPEEDGSILITPGANIQSLLSQKQEADTAGNEFNPQASDKDRLVSLLIGGWCYIERAVLMKAEPTFSKDITEKGYPLWCDLVCEIKMLETATVQNLVGTKISNNRTFGGILGDAQDITVGTELKISQITSGEETKPI